MDMTKKAKAGKLGKLAMPKKRQEEDMMDVPEEEADPMDDLPLPEESHGADAADEGAAPAAAEGLSDEELMAELKKRGLMSKLGKEEEGEEESDQEQYS